MAGPSIGTWVKVRNKSGRLTARVIAKKHGGGEYEQGQVISQSEYNAYKARRAEDLSRPDVSSNSTEKKANINAKTIAWIEKNESSPFTVKLQGMSTEETMKSVEYKGIKIAYPPTEQGRAIASETMQAIHSAGLPPGLSEHTKRLVLTTQRNKRDTYWEKQYKIPGFKSSATGGNGVVVVYGGKKVKPKTLAHEMGHNLANARWGSGTPPSGSKYAEAQKKEPPVSDYGRRAPAEDFADAVAFYHLNPTAFKKQYPLKSEAIEELIKG